ncbi:MAG: 1-(5-phosphoribosyl)-5-[(5-phosphoribosylamino)methylideneamino] imidazole-4-carboxamide isomerase [Gemmatimonadetes bacterium]|nr:1-(5-phosphoribosyl)-5-[(5-phosphoribosylamino)methylideneamino] imidazole-4-carboxamide isomerase [Gemmatimonadota bacterium]MBI3504598.1 1-(5-phosphoribosyl)-5-[(5-phosphoribosylamino)methylideneamino] imidazole-4-carboxamide isomerase [Pseudomonadota bacterium]
MIVIPAIDLREGHVVQLVGGDYAKEAVRLDDPRDVARRWVNAGFARLHVVDLDAATGRGDNRDAVRDLLRDATVPVQVGGGIRDASHVDDLLADGASWIVVGTRALADHDWLVETARANPGVLIVATDVRDRRVVTHGWTRDSRRSILDVVDDLAGLPLGGLLVTAVHREGQMQGTDLPLMEDVADASEWPVFASGGIASLADLRALDDRGIAGAVLGMALYTGALDPRLLLEEFAP